MNERQWHPNRLHKLPEFWMLEAAERACLLELAEEAKGGVRVEHKSEKCNCIRIPFVNFVFLWTDGSTAL